MVRSSLSTPTVCILTLCRNLTYLYGTLTTLRTIRTGFPTARVLVCDNASLCEAQIQIREAAQAVGAQFLPLTPLGSLPLRHEDILRGLIQDKRPPFAQLGILQGPLVILDGDILFWQDCESWQFAGLLAGRLIPARAFDIVHPPVEENGLLLPRLHTSFWWIPNRRKLRQRIMEIQRIHLTWDPFTPWMVPDPSGVPLWYVGDTGSNLYGALRKDVTPFTTAHLDAYDHLSAGSTPVVIEQLCADPSPGYEWFPRVHAAAQRGDLSSIRGVWREQEAFFNAGAQRAVITTSP